MSTEECEQLRETYGIDKQTKVIVNIGELLPNKNQKLAIDAMKTVVRQYPESLLLIAGNGPEEEALKRQVQENGLKEHVRFLGYTRDVHQYLNISDMLVACSFREGLPLNLMEAMLCGKPIVASENRGHRELVEPGATGYLVSPRDAEMFGQRICQILDEKKDYEAAIFNKVSPFIDKNVSLELKELYLQIM
jgi:glycosyltransferase EpsD